MKIKRLTYVVKILKEFNKKVLSLVITELTCLIPMNHFQWETYRLHLETIFTGVQRTDGELCHMVQRQSPEAQYQQDQRACGGLPEKQERGSEEGGLIQVPWAPNQ